MLPCSQYRFAVARPSHDLRQRLARGTMGRPLGDQHHEGTVGAGKNRMGAGTDAAGTFPPAGALLPSSVFVTVLGTHPGQDGHVCYNAYASRLQTMEEVVCRTPARAG